MAPSCNCDFRVVYFTLQLNTVVSPVETYYVHTEAVQKAYQIIHEHVRDSCMDFTNVKMSYTLT